MTEPVRVLRFNVLDRLFHLFIMVTFLIQATTGLARALYGTFLGTGGNQLLRGYESASYHPQPGGHVSCSSPFWCTSPTSCQSGMESLAPKPVPSRLPGATMADVKQLGRQIRWFFGLGPRLPSTAGPTGKSSITGRCSGACRS